MARFRRRPPQRRRSSHLEVVVLPNEATAFQAYRLLQYHGISPENLAIVGEGYSSPERVGLLKRSQLAWRRSQRLSVRSLLSGTLMGCVAVVAFHLEVNWIAVISLTGLMSGLSGAIVGWLIGYFGEGSTASIYRHHLEHGRYLLMMEGPETLVRWGQEVLSHYSAPSPH